MSTTDNEETGDIEIGSRTDTESTFDQTEAENISVVATTCSICLEELVDEDGAYVNGGVRRLECAHLFHENCIRRWTRRNQTCPVCRVRIDSTDERTTPPADETTRQLFERQEKQLSYILYGLLIIGSFSLSVGIYAFSISEIDVALATISNFMLSMYHSVLLMKATVPNEQNLAYIKMHGRKFTLISLFRSADLIFVMAVVSFYNPNKLIHFIATTFTSTCLLLDLLSIASMQPLLLRI